MEYIGGLSIWALILVTVSGFILVVAAIAVCIFTRCRKENASSSASLPLKQISSTEVFMPVVVLACTDSVQPSQPQALLNVVPSLPVHVRDVLNDQIYANLEFEPLR